ncbi:MAG: hypothetical protein ACXABY_11625 [Candidatus Thorarchaeota archaeon]|jgi:hypothetical protein
MTDDKLNGEMNVEQAVALEGWLKVNVQDEGNQITDGDYFIPIYTLA